VDATEDLRGKGRGVLTGQKVYVILGTQSDGDYPPSVETWVFGVRLSERKAFEETCRLNDLCEDWDSKPGTKKLDFHDKNASSWFERPEYYFEEHEVAE
jgi:hypothetical protein